eukprot:1069498_1
MQCVQNIESMTENSMQSITELLERNADNIADINLFATVKPLAFGRMIRKHTGLRVPIGVRLYRSIKGILKQRAQKEQFGQFLSDLDINTIHTDYHHILDIHINHGNKESIKNVFRFFHLVVHFDDKMSDLGTQCRSIIRKKDRLKSLNAEKCAKDPDPIQLRMQSNHHKDIWELKQHYTQSELDIIHCHLVHSDLQRELKRFAERHADDQKHVDIEEYKSEEDVSCISTDKSKFITELSQSDTADYGFGVNHHHPYLKPIHGHDSIHDELLLNTLHRLSVNQLQHALVKAIKKHCNHIKRD